jgi:hypothetical protein
MVLWVEWFDLWTNGHLCSKSHIYSGEIDAHEPGVSGNYSNWHHENVGFAVLLPQAFNSQEKGA